MRKNLLCHSGQSWALRSISCRINQKSLIGQRHQEVNGSWETGVASTPLGDRIKGNSIRNSQNVRITANSGGPEQAGCDLYEIQYRVDRKNVQHDSIPLYVSGMTDDFFK